MEKALDISEKKENEKDKTPVLKKEYGGRKGPEPVRYGDWESKGKCIDF